MPDNKKPPFLSLDPISEDQDTPDEAPLLELAQLRRDLAAEKQKNEALEQALDLAQKGFAKIPGYPLGSGAFLLDENTALVWRAQLERVQRNLEALRQPGQATYRREELRATAFQEVRTILEALPPLPKSDAKEFARQVIERAQEEEASLSPEERAQRDQARKEVLERLVGYSEEGGTPAPQTERHRVETPLTEEQKSGLNELAKNLSVKLEEEGFSRGEVQAFVVLLCVYWIRNMLAALPEVVTVEGLADSIRESILRTWRKTAARRDQ